MRCDECPMQWCESNESTYPAQYGCGYGEVYYDEHSIEFKDGSDGCRKHYKTVLRDSEKALEEAGKESTGVIETYLLDFELATEQLKKSGENDA